MKSDGATHAHQILGDTLEKHSKSVSHTQQSYQRGDREIFNRSTVIQSNEFPNDFGMGYGSRA